MEVQVAETGPCSRALTITVPPALVDEQIEQMYGAAQKQIQIKGFRAGKVPRHVIQKRFGDGILAEAKEQLLNRYFGEACREKELNPVGRIQIEEFETLEVQPGQQLAFTAKIDVKPTFTLPEIKGIEVPSFEAEANDQDVDNALKEIAHQKRKIQTTDEAVADGDFVKCDYTFHDEGGAEVHARKGVQLNTRIPIHGVEEAVYAEALIGAKTGDSREMAITFPEKFEKEAVRGKTGTVKVQVHEVLRVSPPPIDDALAKELEFEDLAGLRQDLAGRIGMEKTRLGKIRQEDACLEHLSNNTEIALPPSLVEEQKHASLGQFAQRMHEQGASDDEIKAKLAESDADAQKDAERRVKLFFLIEAVAKQAKVFVTETDVEGELRNIAAANSNEEQAVAPAQVREFLEKQNRMGELRLALLERKVRDFLRENAKAVDKTGS
ncbi:MAG: trigger factor [Planctomycetes bacterium]|nr:trigger factor [Planctomycetota bacterium]